MKPYELPILISEGEEGYSIAVALSDSVVVSRRLTRADLSQLHARLSHILGARLEHQDLAGAEDD